MKTINQLYDSINRRDGHWKAELLLPLTKIHEWWVKRKLAKAEKQEYEWYYECGCTAKHGAFSTPYCPKHGLYLMRRKKIQDELEA